MLYHTYTCTCVSVCRLPSELHQYMLQYQLTQTQRESKAVAMKVTILMEHIYVQIMICVIIGTDGEPTDIRYHSSIRLVC